MPVTYPDNVEPVELQRIYVNGSMAAATETVLKAAAPASSTYRFTHSYTFIFQGHHVSFKSGSAYVLDAPLKAALLAASAPMVSF